MVPLKRLESTNLHTPSHLSNAVTTKGIHICCTPADGMGVMVPEIFVTLGELRNKL